MKRVIILSATLILIVLIGLVAVINYTSLSKNNEPKPFYVGVTYCGNSTTEAEQLIDRVKNYTNLFVLQSGPLMQNLTASQEICDYAVNSGLNIILYYSNNGLAGGYLPLIDMAEARWGSNFLGVYYNDEPGGKMLDSSVMLYNSATGISVNKGSNGWLQESYSNESNGITTRYDYQFLPSGEIIAYISTTFPDWSSEWNTTTYFTNGTISFSAAMLANGTVTPEEPLWYQPDGTEQDENGTIVTGKGDISQFTPYQQVWDSRPLQTYTETAYLYVNAKHHILNTIGNKSTVKLFTSDYALYWFDYQAGYDTVWAQLGWNNNPMQEIALVRGAANMQNKNWGTMITWITDDYPSLPSGAQMYDAMRQSYESGAEYVVVFNYTPDNDPLKSIDANGTRVESEAGLLQDEHYDAIERFWNDVVQNPQVTHGVKTEAAFVLPNSYGWGMRSQNDNIWGLWKADSTSEQIWTQLQSKLAQYGSKLDIVYDDPAYPTTGKYNQIYFWNQPS